MKHLMWLLILSLGFLIPQDAQAMVPLQVPITDPLYSKNREWAYRQINPMLDQCAKFVNRMLLKRFNISTFGAAWTMQLHPDNQKYLELIWRIEEEDFDREHHFKLNDYQDRAKHFQALYEVLDDQDYPVGVIGFLYHYSQHKYQLQNHPLHLPQTHVAFVAGKMDFTIMNPKDYALDVQSILRQKYGTIHAYERNFINTKVPLDRILQPGESITYQDYLIEDQFKVLRATSLLNVMLEKHWYNKITPLLRPVSYSALHPDIIEQINNQNQILSHVGAITYLSGAVFESIPFQDKEAWKKSLAEKIEVLDTTSWKNLPLVPIPRY